MAQSFIISVTAKDRVGIVADVTAVIRDLGGNLENISQTVMRSYFSMIVLASFPEKEGLAPALQKALAQAMPDVSISIIPFVPEDSNCTNEADEHNQYVLTAVGVDAPGQVACISQQLRENKVNIIDLATHVSGGEHTMFFIIDLFAKQDVVQLLRTLQEKVKPLGLKVELRHQDIFRKTNEI